MISKPMPMARKAKALVGLKGSMQCAWWHFRAVLWAFIGDLSLQFLLRAIANWRIGPRELDSFGPRELDILWTSRTGYFWTSRTGDF